MGDGISADARCWYRGTVRQVLVLALTLVFSAQPAWADEALTARNKALVRDFYTMELIGRDVDAAPRFFWLDYIQHNPQVPTGLKGFMDTFRAKTPDRLQARIVECDRRQRHRCRLCAPDVDRPRRPASPSPRVRHVPRAGRYDSPASGRRLKRL
jgi:hypothetical protein